MDEVLLERREEALLDRVVVGVAAGPDRPKHAMVGELLGVVDRGVLAAGDALMFVR
jgi:hypothetical protein